MIQSMTAFARQQAEGDWGLAICEIRCLNHRYLEFSTRLPDSLRVMETKIRDFAKKYIQRGKLEIFIRYYPGSSSSMEFILNKPLINTLRSAHQEITQELQQESKITAMEILRWPNMLETIETSTDTLQSIILKLFETTLKKLIENRENEGSELKKLLLQHLENMNIEVEKIKTFMPEILKQQREKVLQKISATQLNFDENRLEQELVLLTQKSDITEELDRLAIHMKETHRVLKQGGAVGRRLDFLLQELNREANTIASKSIHSNTTHAAVELKVFIEQMREQVQNIE
ncbi:MAG: YicC family protein [Proteobacteria bacterium]|nr:YicC family protein [Pseudomonadota bacterium]